jgi:hypothetical protein
MENPRRPGRSGRPTYRLTLVALDHPCRPEIRLRAALKTLLRSFRLRCLEIDQVAAEKIPEKN